VGGLCEQRKFKTVRDRKNLAIFMPAGLPPTAIKELCSPAGLTFYSMEGFILTWRKIMETSFYKNSYCFHLAMHLLLKANHQDKEIIFNGKPILIKRGSCIVGRKTLSEDTGIAQSTVRNKLASLRQCGFLDSKSTNKFSIITILNYDNYQNYKKNLGQQTRQPEDSQRTARGQPEDTNKECNNVNNVNKDTIPPPLEEVLAYCKERNKGVDPHKWFNHYQAKGWLIGKTKMKDWRAAIRTWEHSEEPQSTGTTVRRPL
jgi:hypothetical protein